jgi:CheY-like chemotaxis protein
MAAKSTEPIMPSSAPLVLVIENDPLSARLCCEMLKAGGYRTEVAETAQDGLRLAEALRPLLIVTDLQLPGMDGLALTRALKADRRLAMIPVVALTAHVMPQHRQQALAAGCATFLAKPQRLNSFLTEIAHVVDHCCTAG